QWGAYHEAMETALDRLRKFYVTREELHTAREYELTQADFRWQKMSEKAQSLGYYSSLKQLSYCTEYRDWVSHVTLEDIVRVIEKYLTEEPSITQMLPEEKEETAYRVEEVSHHGSEHRIETIRENQTLVKFDSGLEVLYCYDPDASLCSADLLVKNLSESLFRFPPGTAYLMQKLISRGTALLSAEQIMKTMDQLGGRYSTVCSDSSTRKDLYRNSLMAPTSAFWEAFQIFSSFFTQASFPDREISKSRDSILLEIKSLPDFLSAFCHHHMMKNYFQSHPYGIPFVGSEKSVSTITRRDMEELYAVLYSAGNLLLTISGPFPLQEVIQKTHESLNRNFGALQVGFEDSKIPEAFQSPRLGTTDSVQNTKEQAYLIRTYPAPGFRDSGFFTAQVTNEILGGGMSSRFFRVLRDEKSYGYEVGSRYIPYLPYGIIYSFLGTDPARLDDASKDFETLITEIKEELVDEKELEKAKNLVISRFSFARETLAGRASMAGAYLARNIDASFLDSYVDSVQNVSAKMVQDFSRQVFASVFEQRVHP
ncbi:insulinase family protein, partial [bacterium]|nr:insulinase family protein [bacterium]